MILIVIRIVAALGGQPIVEGPPVPTDGTWRDLQACERRAESVPAHVAGRTYEACLEEKGLK